MQTEGAMIRGGAFFYHLALGMNLAPEMDLS